MVTEPDEVLQRAAEAMAAGEQGDRAGARAIFEELWEAVGPDGDPLHRCSIAHWLADVQDDPRDELAWDLRALDAARGVTDERMVAAGKAGPAEALFPSLHLNLADVHLRLGQRAAARRHVDLGRDRLDALGDDGYADMIRHGLIRIEEALQQEPDEGPGR